MTSSRGTGRLVIVTAGAVLALAACSTSSTASVSSSTTGDVVAAESSADLVNPQAQVDGPITIGYLDLPSNRLMAEVYGKALREAGFTVQLTVPGTNEDLLGAMAAGKVDVVPEYVGPFGDALTAAVKGPDAPPLEQLDLATSLAGARELAGPLGLTLLDATPGSDTIEFVVSTAFAEQTGISTLSELAQWSTTNPMRMGGDTACETRSFCLPYLEDAYGMVVKDYVKVTAEGAVVKSGLVDGGFELGFLPSTDPVIKNPDVTVLAQDVPQVVIGNIAPVVRTDIATEEVVTALNGVSAEVANEDLTAMIAANVVEGVPSARVAGDFISAKGLGEGLYSGETKVVSVEMPEELEAPPSAPAEPGPLRISYAPVTDTEIAARVYAGALVNAGVPVAIGDALEPAAILAAMPSGEVQFAPMRLNAVANILNTEANGNLSLPIEGRNVNKMVAQARDLAGPRGIEVLNASTANVSSAWTVNSNFVANTGITTLGQLARVSQNRPVILAGPPTCPEEVWCQRFLEDEYGIAFSQFVPLDYGGGLTRSAIDSGAVDVGWLSGNDGGIEEFGFTVLPDDLGRESANPVIPVLDADAVTPKIERVLNDVSTEFSTGDLKAMIHAVEFERREVTDVVADWLEANGFA